MYFSYFNCIYDFYFNFLIITIIKFLINIPKMDVRKAPADAAAICCRTEMSPLRSDAGGE